MRPFILFPEDAGKENRRRQRKDTTAACTNNTTLQEKNADGDPDLVPISSDSDMELVGLQEVKSKRKSKSTRKRRRKKSPSLSLSPSSVDLALKESIHRTQEPIVPVVMSKKKGPSHSKSTRQHHSSPSKKLKPQLAVRSSPRTTRYSRLRSVTPVVQAKQRAKRTAAASPVRKTSPLRPRKLPMKKLSAAALIDASSSSIEPPSTRGKVTKLLKKVRRLEPFSTRTKERGSSLKDKLKLSNIIKTKDKDKDEKEEEKEKEKGNEKEKETESEKKNEKEMEKEREKSMEKDKEKEEEKKEKPKEESKSKEKETAAAEASAIIIEEKPVDHIPEKAEPPGKAPEPKKKTPPKEQPKKPSTTHANNTDDDDDVIILRQTAPETKSKKSSPTPPEDDKPEPSEFPEPDEPPDPSLPKLPNFCMDDNDEDLELRMIALHSAVLKKHRTRIQSGRGKRKVAIPRIESPNFVEDFPLLAEMCDPESPKQDIYCLEDMDLDSDIELEARMLCSPYSPSDDPPGISLYSPSCPTETPIKPPQQQREPPPGLDGSFLDPRSYSPAYSPTDSTIFDPDLPGASETLQPPSMPSVGMFQPQQPVILISPFVEPLMVPPPSQAASGFPALHQSVNPMLTAPMFYPVPSTRLAPKPQAMEDFGDTDLDGSPLVSIAGNEDAQSWPLLPTKPLYLAEPSSLMPPPQPAMQRQQVMSFDVPGKTEQPKKAATSRRKRKRQLKPLNVRFTREPSQPRKPEEKPDDKRRRNSVAVEEEEEEGLRQMLLASMGKKQPAKPVETQQLPHPVTYTRVPVPKRPATPAPSAEQPALKKSASTRVVNNAKRYQNLMTQRKLAQQKLRTSAKNRFKVNNEPSTQVVPTGKAQKRIVINLNEDTESDDEKGEEGSSSKERPVLAIPTTEFEKSVDQFLKGVRLQHEMAAATPPKPGASQSPKLVEKASVTLAKHAATASVAVPKASTSVVSAASVGTASPAPVVASSPSIAATVVAASSRKDKIVASTPKPLKIGSRVSDISATPQVSDV